MKFKKGDKVKIVVGKDRGREGKIERVYNKQNKVLIAEANIYKRHIKKSEQMPQGGVVELPRPLGVSKIMFVCPKCSKLARLGYKVEKNKKFRICKKCKSKI